MRRVVFCVSASDEMSPSLLFNDVSDLGLERSV